jgi:hypothetical protein
MTGFNGGKAWKRFRIFIHPFSVSITSMTVQELPTLTSPFSVLNFPLNRVLYAFDLAVYVFAKLSMEIASHSYPDLLASQVWRFWMHKGKRNFAIRSPDELGEYLSYAYQASLLKEEGKGVSCRIILCRQDELEPEYLLPFRFHVARLTKPRHFDEQEVRRLSPAAAFERSVIAVTWTATEGFQVAGVIKTGAWSRDLVADIPGLVHPIPDWLIVHIRGPGNLVVHQGFERLATLLNGRIEGEGFNIMESKCLKDRWTELKQVDLMAAENRDTIEVRPDFKQISETIFLKQIIREIRDRRHGGTIIFAPSPLMKNFLEPGGAMRVKYENDLDRFGYPLEQLDNEVIRRLVVLAKAKGKSSVGWSEYLEWYEEFSFTITKAYMEMSDWLADMAIVDGCLLLDSRFGVWGYGAEIQVPGAEEEIVYRALDLNANQTLAEIAERSGTRHRTVYRLCRGFPECLAVVVSQDGAVRFVINRNGQVTYWGQLDF